MTPTENAPPTPAMPPATATVLTFSSEFCLAFTSMSSVVSMLAPAPMLADVSLAMTLTPTPAPTPAAPAIETLAVRVKIFSLESAVTSTSLALTSASPMRAVVFLATMPVLTVPLTAAAPAPVTVPPACTMNVLSVARTRTAGSVPAAPLMLIRAPSLMLASVSETITFAVAAPVTAAAPAPATPIVAVTIFSLPIARTDRPLTVSVPLVPRPPEVPAMGLPSASFAAPGLTVLCVPLPVLVVRDAPLPTLPSAVPSRSMSMSPLPPPGTAGVFCAAVASAMVPL